MQHLPPHPVPADRRLPPVVIFGLLVAFLAVAVALGISGLGGLDPWQVVLVAGSFAACMVLPGRMLQRSHPYAQLGLANGITLFRAALVAIVASAILQTEPGPGFTLFGIAAVALLLDGADGWAARREGLCSAFGARFDMEVDAAFAAILALLVWRFDLTSDMVGRVSLLILGFSRYGFVLAAYRWDFLQQDLPASQRRKIVCVLQIATLMTCLLPVATPIAPYVLPFAALLLAGSFGRDVIWLKSLAK